MLSLNSRRTIRTTLAALVAVGLCLSFTFEKSTSAADDAVQKTRSAERKTRRRNRREPVEAPLPGEVVTTNKPAAEKADKAADDAKFLRILRTKSGAARSLETAIVTYRPAGKAGAKKSRGKKGVAVDLVAAVHLGEKDYYDDLNKRFKDYDVVLYELVAAQGTRIKQGSNDRNPITSMMRSGLKLESQVELIDYEAENFVHADLSPKEMGEKMKERGHNGFTLAMSVFSDVMRQSNLQAQKMRNNPGRKLPEVGLMELLFDPNASVKLKRMMAEQFDMLDETGGLGETLNVMLIDDRNEAAIKVLKEQIDAGHKKIAIFYGAAHMPDMAERMEKEFDLKRTDAEWIEAWDLE